MLAEDEAGGTEWIRWELEDFQTLGWQLARVSKVENLKKPFLDHFSRQVSIPSSAEIPVDSYQLVIEGISGYGQFGFVAIDDTVVIPGRCKTVPAEASPPDEGPLTVPPTTEPPPGLGQWGCDFDENHEQVRVHMSGIDMVPTTHHTHILRFSQPEDSFNVLHSSIRFASGFSIHQVQTISSRSPTSSWMTWASMRPLGTPSRLRPEKED